MRNDLFVSFRNYLKKELNASHPVSIHRVKLVDCEGLCEFDGEQFTIKIDSECSEMYQIDLLIHEYSHALDMCFDRHDANWGRCYAKVYKVYERWAAL